MKREQVPEVETEAEQEIETHDETDDCRQNIGQGPEIENYESDPQRNRLIRK